MITVLEIVLLLIFGLPLCYLAFLSVLALNPGQRRNSGNSRLRRFAIVVPAHDEERTIDATLRSLLAIDYPSQMYDVVVIADNCDDGTAQVANRPRVQILERNDPHLRGKGYALRWGFDALVSLSRYDAVVVVDADSTASRNFLSVMNDELQAGAEAIQSSDLVNPLPGSWSSEIIRIGFLLYNYVRPLGRMALGCSSGLRGNGMCFAVDTLRRVPELLLRGVGVVFAPEATVIAAMPQFAANARSQRARWEMGRYPLVKKYAGRLLRTALYARSYRCFDAFIDLVTPPLVNLLMAVSAMFMMSAILLGLGFSELGPVIWLWAGLMGIGMVHLLVGIQAARGSMEDLKVLLHLPRYALWKLMLYAGMLKKRGSKEWIRTHREAGDAPLPEEQSSGSPA
ncbi:MAG: glycosyltransferase [Ignavibacteria bacterium]|nr:MAG: glycosyltransferase [Ignavibacteria bacterium]